MKTSKIELTQDGSHTLVHPKYNAHYHSKAGAIEESSFIYINEGFNYIKNLFDLEQISVLEMGFGTGLNAFNTFLESEKSTVEIDYVTIEKYPLDVSLVKQLNYIEKLKAQDFGDAFLNMHQLKAKVSASLSSNFNFTKYHQDFFKVDFENRFHVIYFDAFSPNEQPELWSVQLFKLMYNALKSKGVLVTYCSQGNAKRALREVGFTVKRLPGPPSKRHILRAIKH